MSLTTSSPNCFSKDLFLKIILLLRLLKDTNHVACRITVPRSHLRRIYTHWLNDLPAMGDDRVDAVNHDVDQDSRFR